MNRIEEIDARLAEIRTELTMRADLTAEQIAAYEQEVEQLNAERRSLVDTAERRAALLSGIAAGNGAVVRQFNQPEQRNEPEDPAATLEYRNAWLKKKLHRPLTAAEERAYSSASGYGKEVIPVMTANEILTKIRNASPLLNEVTLLHVEGGVTFAVQGTNNAAALHSENASISAAAETLTAVTLGAYEIVKLVQVSDTVMTMSIDAFEGWLTDMLAESVAAKINSYLTVGTGSSQPGGLNAAQTWGATNSVTVAVSASLTAANVQTLIGLLPAGYDPKAKWTMSKKTLFTDFLPLQDNSKNHLVTNEGKDYFVYGYPVVLNDDVTYHEAFLGDLTKVVANLSEGIRINSAYDIDTNSFKFSAVAKFDSKVGIGESIVKLIKATS